MKKLPAAIFACCALCWPFSAFATDAPPRAKPEAVGMSSERLALIRQRMDAEIAREWMAHSPGTIRWRLREVVNALVYSSIAD